jgi:hypothetical protein
MNAIYDIIGNVTNGKYDIPWNCKESWTANTKPMNIMDFDQTQRAAIYKASKRIVSIHTSSFDNIFVDNNELIYIVIQGKKTFLVNNEGYGYSKYWVEIIGY